MDIDPSIMTGSNKFKVVNLKRQFESQLKETLAVRVKSSTIKKKNYVEVSCHALKFYLIPNPRAYFVF